jgi:hypothetical protein
MFSCDNLYVSAHANTAVVVSADLVEFKTFENSSEAKGVREKFRSLRMKESSTFRNSIVKLLSLFNMPDITCIVLWRKLAEVEKHIEHRIIRSEGVSRLCWEQSSARKIPLGTAHFLKRSGNLS